MEVFGSVTKMKIYVLVVYMLSTLYITGAQNQVTFSLMEESERWTFIGNVSSAPGFLESIPAEDKNNLLFSFLQQTNIKSMLSIHDETGSLYTTVVIDRESLPECNAPSPCVLAFDIAARSQRPDSPLFEIISVNVIIDDINDNAPTFPKDTQVITISESAVNGSSYQIDSADDDDMGENNSIQNYDLVGNKDIFAINVERKLDGSLAVKLIVIAKLDRESRAFYNCTIIARDGGKPVRMGSMKINITILDENDNAPILSQISYDKIVKENIELGTGIVQIQATDKDIGINGQILYRFSAHQSDLSEIKALFQINQYSGVLSVIGRLVYEPGKVYKIIVEAIDQGVPAMLSTNQAVVNVNIKDTGNNPPSMRINLLGTGSGRVVNVSEFSGVGTFVAHVEVEDKDTGQNGVVICGVNGNLFKLELIPNKGYKVVVNGILDRELHDIHTVVVTCEDSGLPSLSSSSSFLVRITDENDNAPKFSVENYEEDLYENNAISEVVITVSARDRDLEKNGEVRYYLDGLVKNYFKIDSISGIITAQQVFDRENKTSWTFKVFATDLGTPPKVGSATVLIRIKDRNDNAPRFDLPIFNFTLQEKLPSGNYIGTLRAKDADIEENAIFTFTRKNSNDQRLPFFLFPKDGVIKNTRELDREVKSRYEFIVLVIDNGSPKLTGSAKVIITVGDENDEKPEIDFPKPDNNTVTIPHLMERGSYITKVVASDADDGINKKLSYVISQGNSDRLFLLDLYSGVLSMAKRYEVEENQEKRFTLIIAVHDGGIPQHSERCELNIVIQYSNVTVGILSDEDMGSSNNVAIVVVVILLTFFLSIAILVVICVLRKYDRDRVKNQNIQINKLSNNMTEIRDNNQNGTILARPYDKVDQSKKRKEVSFSFEDDLDGFRDHEISFSNNSVFMDNTNENHVSHERQPSYQLKTFQLQQALRNSPPPKSSWIPPSSQKSYETKVVGHPEDNHSDTSRETVTSDSGRGGSDEDLPISHNNSKEEKDSHFPSSATANHSSNTKERYKNGKPQKCSVGNVHRHDNVKDRPVSADLSDSRIPNNNKLQFERSLSNLIGNEKPKFTVRKPYIEREVRDKKAQSEGWVPSYV